MSLFAKIMVVVNLILAVVFLAAAGTFLNATESWKAKHSRDVAQLTSEKDDVISQRDAQQTQKETAISAATAAEGRATAAEAKLAVLQTSNEALMAQAAKLEASIGKLADTQQDLQTKNSELNGIIENQRGDIARLQGEKRSAEDQVATLTSSEDRLKQELKGTQDALRAQEIANSDKDKSISELQTTIAMYQDEFGPLKGGPRMQPLDAVVQAVDNVNDIYILSVGANDGVEEGWEFTVYRDGEYIATIVVDKVFGDHASARTKSGLKRKDAQAGDGASTIL